MQNALGAEAPLPAPSAIAPAAGSTLTVNQILDAYLREKRNPFAERVCLTAESIEHHLRAIRALWGEMTVEEFSRGCRQRVKEQVVAWRMAGWQPNTCRTRLSKLRTAFNFAVNEEMIERAPVAACAGLRRPCSQSW